MPARTPLSPLCALVFIPMSSSARPPSSDAEAAIYLFIIIAGGLALLGGIACAARRQRIAMEKPAFSKGPIKLPSFARPPHDGVSARGDGPGRTREGYAAGGEGTPRAARPETPAAPPPSWQEACLEQLEALEQTRRGLADALALGKLYEPARAAKACACIRGELPIHGVTITAAVSRLLPAGLPADEADFWQAQTFLLYGEGEGCYQIGLCDLLIYILFHQKHKEEALNAWRQAVEHFRRGGFAGYTDSMAAARLLAIIGHDVPFSLPEDVQAPLPTEDAVGERGPEAVYWCLRLAEAGDSGHALALARAYRRGKPADRVRAEYWYHRALEGGDSLAGRELFQLYRDGEFTDETGKNGALCLIVATLLSRKAGKLSAGDMAQLEKESGERIGPQLAASKAEGEALALRFRTAAEERERRRQEVFAELCAQPWKNLSEHYRQLEARQGRLPAAALVAKSAAAHAKERTDEPHDRPKRPASSRKDGPRRSFARPDKH